MLARHEVDDKLEAGGVVARLIIEVLGKPQEHVIETRKLLIDRLHEEPDIFIQEVKIADPKEEEAGMFSTFAEVELVTDKISDLIGLCFFYMPSSIEIVEPSDLAISCTTITDLFNDLLGKLHNVDMIAKNLRVENEVHRGNMGKLLRSSVMALLPQKKSSKDIADTLMIPPDQAETILSHLEKEGLVKRVGKHYEPNR